MSSIFNAELQVLEPRSAQRSTAKLNLTPKPKILSPVLIPQALDKKRKIEEFVMIESDNENNVRNPFPNDEGNRIIIFILTLNSVLTCS